MLDQGGKVLVVDDDHVFVSVVTERLKKEGYSFTPAYSSLEAMEALSRENFDVALVDLVLPDLPGLELIRQMRLSDPDMPVIVVSGLRDALYVKEAMREGAYDYLTKPLNLDEMVKAVASAIEHRRFLELKRRYQEELERKVKEREEKIREMFINSIKSLVKALEARDPYTKNHSVSVMEYSMAIARAMGLDGDMLKKLELASLLHDIGKIGVSDSILGKPGRLTPEEYEKVKIHPNVGVEIVSQMLDDSDILFGIKHHHERWDGKGYPDGLSGKDIPILARIISVADSFDAMTSSRPYREAMTVDEALRELERVSWSQLDGDLVRYFLESGAWKLASRA